MYTVAIFPKKKKLIPKTSKVPDRWLTQVMNYEVWAEITWTLYVGTSHILISKLYTNNIIFKSIVYDE